MSDGKSLEPKNLETRITPPLAKLESSMLMKMKTWSTIEMASTALSQMLEAISVSASPTKIASSCSATRGSKNLSRNELLKTIVPR